MEIKALAFACCITIIITLHILLHIFHIYISGTSNLDKSNLKYYDELFGKGGKKAITQAEVNTYISELHFK